VNSSFDFFFTKKRKKKPHFTLENYSFSLSLSLIPPTSFFLFLPISLPPLASPPHHAK